MPTDFVKNWLSFKKKLYYLYFRAFFSFPSMFTFIVINFCWWNLVHNISWKILDGLGWNFIYRLYLGNNLCQQNLEKIDYHLKKSYIIYIFAPSYHSLNVYIHCDKLLLMECFAQHIFKNIGRIGMKFYIWAIFM